MSRDATQPAAHAIMFWLLSVMAFALFAPSVLLPIWEENKVLRDYEAQMAVMVADLEAQRDRNNSRIEALKNDPLVIERIARRDLNFRPAGEEETAWTPEELASVRVVQPPKVRSGESAGEPTPAWVLSLRRWLPDWPWRDLFVKPTNRLLMLTMAGGLLVAAFVLYSPGAARAVASARG
jgi:hypothetical protein